MVIIDKGWKGTGPAVGSGDAICSRKMIYCGLGINSN